MCPTLIQGLHGSSSESSGGSRVRLFASLRTAAHHDPLSIGFSRQEYWSGPPFPSPGDLAKPENKGQIQVSSTIDRVFNI